MKEILIKLPDIYLTEPMITKTFSINVWQNEILIELSKKGVNSSKLVRDGISYMLEFLKHT